jgi:hypothetical protein
MGNSNNDRRRRRPPESAAAEAAGQQTRPAAKFFLAVHRSTLGASRVYRVYPNADGLSFLGVGPPHPWIDVESARKLDNSHWAVRTSRVIRKGLAFAIAGGSAAAGVLGLILLKAVLRDAPKVLDLILFVLTAIGIFVPLGLLVLTGTIRFFTNRVAYIESLSEPQIREEAEREKWYSFWAAAGDIHDVSIGPTETKGARAKAAALLSFTHPPTGKWKLELVAPKDARIAGRAFLQMLGQAKVAVDTRLAKD